MYSNYTLLVDKVNTHLDTIYTDVLSQDEIHNTAQALLDVFDFSESKPLPTVNSHNNLWDQQDIVLITYADSIIAHNSNDTSEGDTADSAMPLKLLHGFLKEHCQGIVTSVHILPFFPYSSDDGFSVIDYSQVNQGFGDWEDIQAIAQDFSLMVDLVINHCSARSVWFENFTKQEGIGHDFFMTAEADEDLHLVVRPRTSPLLRPTPTATGEKHVWCTFSHDQVDFDFRNPKVLIAMCEILKQYVDHGSRIFRLDAVAFLWKELGSPCINLPQTHEVIRLIRTLLEHYRHDSVIITETNLPNSENLSYFGNANEAHAIYNFSLPPLLVNTLLSGDCSHLKQWMMSMPPPQNGTFYFNFLASHDGIGLRPAEGLLSETEIQALVEAAQRFGGRVGWRTNKDGSQSPYELNIALIDLCKGTLQHDSEHADHFQVARFLCAHSIMLGLEGVPAFYIHSLLARGNDYERMKNSGQARGINRHRWLEAELTQALADEHSMHAEVFSAMSELIKVRQQQRAFHPNATQFTLHLGTQIFSFWRQSLDRRQSIFCLSNISTELQQIPLSDINLIEGQHWHDLISQSQVDSKLGVLQLAPYQTVWLSNTPIL